jgi:methyl-accepting chemotaxis protein
MMKRQRIGVQLLLVVIVTLLLALGASFTFQYRTNASDLDRLSQVGWLNTFSSTHAGMSDSLEKGDMDLFANLMDRVGKTEGVEAVRLLRADGTIAYKAGKAEISAVMAPAALDRISAAASPILMPDKSVLDVYQADIVTPDCIRCHSGWKVGDVGAILHVRYSTVELDLAKRRSLSNSVVALLATVVVLAIVLTVVLRRMVVRPMEAIAAATSQIAHTDLNALVDRIESVSTGQLTDEEFTVVGAELRVETAAEVTMITQAYNGMLARLQSAGEAYGAMVSYLNRIAAAAEEIAQGDLSITVDPQSDQDVLGNAFVTMLVNLRQLIGQVQADAMHLAAASAEITRASSQSAQAVQQVTATIEQVSRGALQQAEAASHAASEVEKMALAIEGISRSAEQQDQAVARVAANVTQIADAVGVAERTAQAGANTVGQAIDAMLAIQESVGGAGRKVEQMQVNSDQIGAIVAAIADIADQTNLLALNAAIEAARAGEHGRGFAVVAGEVGKLAERSRQATRQVTDLVLSIQSGSREAVQAVNASLTQVEAGSALAQESRQALHQILDATQQMNALRRSLVEAMQSVSAVVEQNTASTKLLASGTGEIERAVADVASVSEQNSAAAEEVNAMTEELGNESRQIAASAQALNELAASLQTMLGQFRLTDE